MLDESQTGIRIPRKNKKMRYADDNIHGRKWRGIKEPLDEGERGKWTAGLKLRIHKTKIMAYAPITF